MYLTNCSFSSVIFVMIFRVLRPWTDARNLCLAAGESLTKCTTDRIDATHVYAPVKSCLDFRALLSLRCPS
eukprot:4175251-Amphidinium_carterae.1